MLRSKAFCLFPSIDQFNVLWKSNLYLNAVILWLPEESK